MIRYIEGDMFSSPAQVLVNTVNTVGVMGKGLALEFKNQYARMFAYYKGLCEKHRLMVGKLMLWYAPDHWILQFPTKEHWKDPSKLEYIEKGLMTFTRKYADYNISSIAFPKLGCGNGNLQWSEVKPLMEKYLKELPIDIYIYLGPGNSETGQEKNKSGKNISFEGLKDDIQYKSALIPYSFEYKNEKWSAKWQDEELILDNGREKTNISEDNLHKFWDIIYTEKVFYNFGEEKERAILGLLDHLGYIRRIRLYDEEKALFSDGYQMEMGKDRLYKVG